MIQALIPAITELAGGWLKGKAEEKAATAKAKVARAEAEAEVMRVAATHEAGWEKIMAQGTVHSLKDEWLVLLFSIPLILAFCGEWGRGIVADGFAALSTMPEWYQYSLGVIVASSFAVRSATKFFKK
tara:strand:- start:1078 stop:1461 length:384 start_codon:yes stop_codon:yes gene_type:complete